MALNNVIFVGLVSFGENFSFDRGQTNPKSTKLIYAMQYGRILFKQK